MNNFKSPVTLEEFKERSKDADVKSIPHVLKALERQRAAKVKALDDEIKFHTQMYNYILGGIEPEGLK